MPVNSELYHQIANELKEKNVTLVAVSKTKSVDEILELYNLGQRDFGENYVQELTEKYQQLPKDIHWHFIGHLQSNKVKLIAPFVHLIHSVDSEKLLKEINKQAKKNERTIDCLLQVHIAKEETKFGLDENELEQIIQALNLANNTNEEKSFKNISIKGLMGMASFTDDKKIVRHEFHSMKSLFDKLSSAFSFQPPAFSILSMGMSSDYKVAIEEGSTLVRIGSLLFGKREQKKQ
ncbi:MAG: YggS family pyridoxal phosphate-dependent enzyme [Ginsengibacter sp.]